MYYECVLGVHTRFVEDGLAVMSVNHEVTLSRNTTELDQLPILSNTKTGTVNLLSEMWGRISNKSCV